MSAKSRAALPIIDARSLSLDAWLTLVLTPDHKRKFRVADYEFPTDQLREEYLETIAARTESSVKALLRRFLSFGGSLGTDERTCAGIYAQSPEEVERLVDELEFVRNLIEPPFLPWQGMTWVLDLLPDNPAKSMNALDAFFTAHSQFLPDGRARGIWDAETIIRRRYLHSENPRDSLLSLRPSEFEYLIAALYKRMGYEVQVTKASRDGGLDVEARQHDLGGRALVLIQCKRYEGVIRVEEVRQLMGVVARRQANKGVLVVTSSFTKPARDEAAQNTMIELIDFSELNKLLNRYFGAKWPQIISYHIRESQLTAVRASVTNKFDVRGNLRNV